jgi:hypothetical protein
LSDKDVLLESFKPQHFPYFRDFEWCPLASRIFFREKGSPVFKAIGTAIHDIEIPGKLIAIMPGYEGKFEGIPFNMRRSFEIEKSYITGKGEIKVEGASGEAIRIYEQKSIRQGESTVTIPEATLKPGIYSAFNGPDSAVILDEKGGLIVVLIGNGDDCDLYIATEASVTGTLIQNQKERELPGGGKVSFQKRV